MRIGVVFGRFAGMVCRMKPVSVRDMRVVRGLFVVFFDVVFGSFAVVGRSMLVDPMGTVRLDLGSAEGVATGGVDTSMTAQTRAVLPCLSNRRDDVFAPAAEAARSAVS